MSKLRDVRNIKEQQNLIEFSLDWTRESKEKFKNIKTLSDILYANNNVELKEKKEQ